MAVLTNGGSAPFNILSLCSGVGGLDIGVSTAIEQAKTVCYVERDVYAAAVLVHRMEEKILDEAPIWDDLKSFDGKPWRGKVDCIIGGYPCQPFSVGGKMLGEKDPRHLWPYISGIIKEINPPVCFFENVSGHLLLGFKTVHDDLESMGYRVACGLFTATEIGAPHRRERLFILAVADDFSERLQGKFVAGTPQGAIKQHSGNLLADADGAVDIGYGGYGRVDESGTAKKERNGSQVLDASSDGGKTVADSGHSGPTGEERFLIFPPMPGDVGSWEKVIEQRPELAPALAYGDHARKQKQVGKKKKGEQASRRDNSDGRGSDDADVSETVRQIESQVYRMAYGVASRMDRLRACGNGVVPLQAAHAFNVLRTVFGL